MTAPGSADILALLKQADRALLARRPTDPPLHAVASLVCYGEDSPEGAWRKTLRDLPSVPTTHDQQQIIVWAIDMARARGLNIPDDLVIHPVSATGVEWVSEGLASFNYTDGSAVMSLDVDQPLTMLLATAFHELQHISDFSAAWAASRADGVECEQRMGSPRELERRARAFAALALGERLVEQILRGGE